MQPSPTLRSVFWGVQHQLHGTNGWFLPVLLVLTATSMVLYRHMTADLGRHDPVKTFLCLIVGQMLPLVFLEIKILKCPDPVGVLSMFGEKVLLMYMSFLSMRVLCMLFAGFVTGYWNTICLVAVFVALHKGFQFQFSLQQFFKHIDVACLVTLCLVAGLFTGHLAASAAGSSVRNELQYIIDTASNYIELLTFVPAVWIVSSVDKRVSSIQVDFKDLHMPALCFFSFLLSFYTMEDLVQAGKLFGRMPFASAGHIVHYMLLLDFATFILAQIYNPEKLKKDVMTWLPQ